MERDTCDTAICKTEYLKDKQESGCCPKCNSDRTCSQCSTSGNEYGSIVFDAPSDEKSLQPEKPKAIICICACGCRTPMSGIDNADPERRFIQGHNITMVHKEMCKRCIHLNAIPFCAACYVYYEPDYRFKPGHSFFEEERYE